MTGEIRITTNNHWHELVTFEDLPESKKSDFDYVGGEDRFSQRFVSYRGCWYDLFEFMVVDSNAPEPLHGWQGVQSDSYFSGAVIRYDGTDFERVQIGRYCC